MTRHPRMGAAELPWVALWLPLKRRELRDRGSHIATFVIVQRGAGRGVSAMAKAKPILRTRTVSPNVKQEEFFGLEAQATEPGVNLGEWVGEARLESGNGQGARAATGWVGSV